MSWSLRRRINLLNLSYFLDVHLNSLVCRIYPQLAHSVGSTTLDSTPSFLQNIPGFSFPRFTTSNCSSSNPSIAKGVDCFDKFDGADQHSVVCDTDSDVNDDDSATSEEDGDNENLDFHIGSILDILRSKGVDESSPNPSPAEARNKLDQCGISASSDLVIEILSRIRNNWEMAFMFFLWAGKQPGYVHSLRVYHSMISILAKRRKFDTAWGLIDEMRKGGGRDNGESLVTPNTLLIMIRRYSAVHDVASAINTFHSMKRFGFQIGVGEFQQLLSSLCRYKNVQDAEHLLFSNRNTFQFETKSFNIILNGWCNVIGSQREGLRFWKVMIEKGIKLDVISYSSIISSYSKTNKLKDVLRLYDKMKSMGISPDRKVYNGVIHALAKNGHVNESLNLLKAMENDGVSPNTVTYNSLIKPLSRARKRDDAEKVYDEMLQRKLQPTIRTFHALLRMQRTTEDVFRVLSKMKETGCDPRKDTYVMLVRKFCRWGEVDCVFKLWGEMNERGLNDDSSSYIVLIHGLFLNGKVEEAYRVYVEMKERLLIVDEKTDEMIQTWLRNKEMAEMPTVGSGHSWFDVDGETTDVNPVRKRGESRKVVKQRGFSFWK